MKLDSAGHRNALSNIPMVGGDYMLSDLFVNITILVSFLFIFGQLYRGADFEKRQPYRSQLLIGLIFGALGFILMVYTINITDNVIIDLRNIAILSSGIMGGPISALVSSVVIASFRIIYFGINKASLVAATVAFIIAASHFIIYRYTVSRLKRFSSIFLLAMIISSMALSYLLLPNYEKLLETLFYYWPIYIFGAVLSYYALEYIINTNLTYKTMAYNTLMADNLMDMLTIHNLDGKFIYASPSAKNLLGYFPLEILGKNILDFIELADRETLWKAFNDNMDNSSSTPILRMKKKTGEYIWVETSVKHIYNKGLELREIVCATRDITIRKNIEQKLKEAKHQAEQLAATDYLTGCMNRRSFVERLSSELRRAERDGLELSLILTDIDRFKRINDTYGHNNGDLVLQIFTECLSKTSRPYDFIGRHGGEEFIICLPNTHCENAMLVAERLRNAVEQLSISLNEVKEPIKITASFGVATYTRGEITDIEMLISKADRAMYKAKANGRNQVCQQC